VGTFIAQSLAKRQSPPEVTLFMANWGMFEAYRQRKKRLAITYDGLSDGLKNGVDIEVLEGNKWFKLPRDYGEKYKDNGQRIIQEEGTTRLRSSKDPIDCLIVSCKSNHAFLGIRSLAYRLSSKSTILITQNGLGIVERLNRFIFTNPSVRPKYLHAVFSHGLDKKDMYQVKYKKVGMTSIAPPVTAGEVSLMKPEDDTTWTPSTKYLARLFTLTPSLTAVVNTPTNVLMYQLEKLAVSCVIEPLTAINDCRNGDLLYVESVSRIMRLLLFEISRVILALPELQGVPGLEDRFEPERLRRMAVSVLNQTRDNTSTMLHDVRGRKGTEIEYLNGYIVRRGEELGITCALNYMIKHLIHGKQVVNNRQEAEAIPIDAGSRSTDSHHLTGLHLNPIPGKNTQPPQSIDDDHIKFESP
jgi:2-dehydropantoate 2-reductase